MAVLQLSRLQHDEQRVAVNLDLGALVGVVSVLNGQIMQTEGLLDLPLYRVVRLMQSEPHEGAGRGSDPVCAMPNCASPCGASFPEGNAQG
jgi:hypothetical protein